MTSPERSVANSFEVKLDCGDAGPIVRLRGTPTLDQADTLRDHLLALSASLNGRLVVDLTELEFINSVGLGAMVTAHLRCQRLGGWLRLANPSPEIRRMLVVTNLLKLFDVYDSVGEAIRAGPAAAAP